MSSCDASPSLNMNDVPRGSRSPSLIHSSNTSSGGPSSRSSSRDSSTASRKSSRASSRESSLPSTRPASRLLSDSSPRASTPIEQEMPTIPRALEDALKKHTSRSKEPQLSPCKAKKTAKTPTRKSSVKLCDDQLPAEPELTAPLKEQQHILTPGFIQSMDVRGGIFRGLKGSVVANLNSRPIAELFDSNQAGTPVIFTSHPDDFDSCIVVEATHRFSSLRSRVLEETDRNLKIQVKLVPVTSSEYDAIWAASRSITYVPGVDTKEKAHFASLPMRVTRYLRATFAKESMRTKGAYDDYTKAINMYEFLCARFDEEYRNVLRQNTRYHHLVMKMLHSEKLITKECQAEAELSGFYAYLMTAEVRTLFFENFDEMPALNKAHSLLYRASKNHSETVVSWMKERCGENNKLFPKGAMVRKLQMLVRQDERTITEDNANGSDDEISDEKTSPKAKKSKKSSLDPKPSAPTTATGLIVLSEVGKLPQGSLLVVKNQVPKVNELVGKGISVVVVDPVETVSVFTDMAKLAKEGQTGGVLRIGEYYKRNFVAAGPLIKPGTAGTRLSATTIPTLLVKLTDSEGSRARMPKVPCYTLLDHQPKI